MKLYSKNELKDSRIFFDKQPPRFGTYFSIIVAFILIASLIASKIISKSYIVKAQGVIRSSDSQYISSNVNGTVIDVLKKEGSSIKKGDVLLIVSDGAEALQEQTLKEQLTLAYEKIEAMNKYQKSMDDLMNYMKNEGIEQEYYGYMEYFLQQKESDSYSKVLESKEITKKEKKLDEILNEINSLESEKNKLKLQNYTTKIKVLEKNIVNLNNELIRLEEGLSFEVNEEKIIILKDKINFKKQQVVNCQDELENFENKLTTLDKIETQLESKLIEKESMEEGLNSIKNQFENPANQTSQMKSQLIMELGKNRNQVETQIKELEANLKLSTNQKNTYQIKASQDGVLHYIKPIRTGLSIQQNQVIADISSQTPGDFIVEAYIQALDISRVSLNDDVNVAVNGVNTTKYGTIKGKLVFIDSGTVSQETQEGNMLLYKIKVSIDSYKLRSNKDIIEIISSMPVEARIIYQKETYLDWLLDILNLKN